ncbi:MAG TPA: hypothetical protein DD451_00615 [Candidatus Moranbacteria bacterium]|nr:hypothetical protein [Candidatus Moranbacteria bacterium]
MLAINASAKIPNSSVIIITEEIRITKLQVIPLREGENPAIIKIGMELSGAANPVALWETEDQPGKFFTRGISVFEENDGSADKYLIVIDTKEVHDAIGPRKSFGLRVGYDSGENFCTKEIIIFSMMNPRNPEKISNVPAIVEDEYCYLPKKNMEVKWQP